MLASSKLRHCEQPKITEGFLVLGVLLVAFGLRVFRLGNQPLWSDEIYSVAVAQHSASGVAGWVYRDNHPALYWFVLYPVVRLLGDGAALVRFPSALLGTLTVALTYTAGRQILSSRRIGLYSALWLAVSPIHVVYSQEARMYALLALAGIASTLCLYRSVVRGKPLDWILFGTSAAATAHSHNYGLLLVAAQGLWGLSLLSWKRDHRLVRGFVLSTGLFVLLYAPMVPALVAQVQMPVGSTGVATLSDIVDFLRAFGAGFTGFSTPGLTPGYWMRVTTLPAVTATAALSLLGFIGSIKSRATDNTHGRVASLWNPLLLVTCLLFPVVFVYGYSVVAERAVWQVRGFLMTLGCFALLIGEGLAYLRPRLLGWAISLCLIAIAAANLYPHYFNRYKSTIPDAVAAIDGELDTDDVFFVAPYWHWTPFRYYYRGSADAIGGQRDGDSLYFVGVGRDYADLIDSRSLEIQSEVAHPIIFPRQFQPGNYDRVWTISHWATPQQVVRLFGDDVTVMHYDAETRQWRVVLYPVTAPPPDLPASVIPSSLTWNHGLKLVGHNWQTSPRVGQEARFTLFWTTERWQPHRSRLRVQLLDSHGEVALAHEFPMLSLMNGVPMTALGIRSAFPTTAWPVGSIVAQDVEIDIPPHMPPVSYALDLQILDETTGKPVPIAGKTDVILDSMTVARPPEPLTPRKAAVQHRCRISFGGEIELIGFDLPEAPPRPGHHLPIWLSWLAKSSPSADYEVQLRLLGSDRTPASETAGSPSNIPFPTCSWKAGDLARGQFNLPLPPDIDGGMYKVAVRLVDSATARSLPGRRAWSPVSREWTVIGRAQILPWALSTEPPQMDHELNGQFGGGVRLLGYDLRGHPSPGGQLAVTLYWSSKAPLDESYHVFVHLANHEGGLVAQADGIPADWLRPTTTWREGEVITDHHTLEIPPNLPEGPYHLCVGLYQPEGPRLPVISEEQDVESGSLMLESFRVQSND